VIEWDAGRVAAAAAGVLLSGERADGPQRVVIDSRAVRAGDLFVGLPGAHVDGGAYAEQALRAGAWGVLVGPARAAAAAQLQPPVGVVLEHADPLAGLQALAHAWRAELGARVIAITGSTGKTSTKDILAALLSSQLRTVASPANLNTEIGLPLAVLAAPAGTEALVLELAMRGPGQIAELAAIAEPDVGVIVNVGPVHLELLGSLEAIAAAKGELIAALAPGAAIVVPAGEPLLAPHLRADLRTLTFGEGGDVELLQRRAGGEIAIADRTASDRAAGRTPVGSTGAPSDHAAVDRAPRGRSASETGGERLIVLRPSFSQSHNLRNLLAAVAAARALHLTPSGRVDVTFSALRGERIALANEIVLINDCYNANPMSMRAALDDLAATAPARRVAVLGDMLELGPRARDLHRELAADAADAGVELLLAVGPLARGMSEVFAGEVHCVPDAAAAAQLLTGLLRPRDTVLVKGSRGVGLELVAETLAGAH
jgi:UDP-N-acetylmuramoyl-tripeptide--D-alanyl-D-alanine ligase